MTDPTPTPTPTPPAPTSTPTPTPPVEEAPLSAEDAKAIRKTADKAMQERNAARDEAKKFSDLGLTPEEIAQLKADRDAKNGGPTPEQIQKDAEKRAETAARRSTRRRREHPLPASRPGSSASTTRRSRCSCSTRPSSRRSPSTTTSRPMAPR
jgi:hypothetical protein